MSDQTTSTPDYEDLERRVAELESNVKEIGYVLYDLIQELRGQEGLIDGLAEPPCPPLCERS